MEQNKFKIDLYRGCCVEKQKTKASRRNYLVLKGFQLRFSGIIFIAAVVISVICVWTTYVTTWNEVSAQIQEKSIYYTMEDVYKNCDNPEARAEMISSFFAIEFAKVFERVSNVLFLRLMTGILILFLLSIFASHKIAGPLFRITKTAKAMGEGDFSIGLDKLRDGDEFGELAKALNQTNIKIRAVLKRCKIHLSELMRYIKMVSSDKKQTPEKINEACQAMEKITKELQEEIEFFKISQNKDE